MRDRLCGNSCYRSAAEALSNAIFDLENERSKCVRAQETKERAEADRMRLQRARDELASRIVVSSCFSRVAAPSRIPQFASFKSSSEGNVKDLVSCDRSRRGVLRKLKKSSREWNKSYMRN